MISLTSDLTDGKGRHAQGWLFYDAECAFCTRFAKLLARTTRRRGLAIAPLQDPRVGILLGLSQRKLLREIRFVSADGTRRSGANALIALANELWWARPLAWIAIIPGGTRTLNVFYEWIARRRKCRASDADGFGACTS